MNGKLLNNKIGKQAMCEREKIRDGVYMHVCMCVYVYVCNIYIYIYVRMMNERECSCGQVRFLNMGKPCLSHYLNACRFQPTDGSNKIFHLA